MLVRSDIDVSNIQMNIFHLNLVLLQISLLCLRLFAILTKKRPIKTKRIHGHVRLSDIDRLVNVHKSSDEWIRFFNES